MWRATLPLPPKMRVLVVVEAIVIFLKTCRGRFVFVNQGRRVFMFLWKLDVCDR